MTETLSEMSKMPLFMTSINPEEENADLDALKALAYEGTKLEVASNFREQGNECARERRWGDAGEFYRKAVQVLRGKVGVVEAPAEEGEGGEVEMDLRGKGAGRVLGEVYEDGEGAEEERRREMEVEEVCYVNRALCHLELKNYRSATQDCAAALRLNPRNIKAYYRSASACLALDKIPEAEDACQRGLEIDDKNAALKTLKTRIAERKTLLETQERKRRDREERIAREKATLKQALKQRNISLKMTGKAPEMEDAEIKLSDPFDASSTLAFPVILLYPLDLQSDFIKEFKEDESLNAHLEYILPLPWDERGVYTMRDVECYVETEAGGLIKAGKKLPLGKILGSGKVAVTDGLVKVNVVVKEKAGEWIEEVKRRKR
ncbi:TPR repeat protein-like protein [Aulographum hederae CBS 113979]|uniref:TPR repeat protein-like protein n=1 Tax=Aulographum hederae CBS 113979 TaxID=1176131 RepID=A0A6G1GYA4_9PEZI|nr:TPR repeat protein-like protein [Aulographum hederae CBS 113979]